MQACVPGGRIAMGGRTRRSVIVGGCVVSRRRGGIKGPKAQSLEKEHNEPIPSPLTWKTLESMSRLPTSSMNTTNLAIPFPASGDRADAGVAVAPPAAPAFFVECCWARDGEALPPLLALLPSVLVLVEGAVAPSWAPADAADPSPAAPAAAGAVGGAIRSVDFFYVGGFRHLEQAALTLLP